MLYYRMTTGYSGYVPVNGASSPSLPNGQTSLGMSNPVLSPNSNSAASGTSGPIGNPLMCSTNFLQKWVVPHLTPAQINFLFKNRLDKKKPQQQPVKCDTCNLTLNSQQQAEQHFGGKAHLKMLRRKGLPVPEEHIAKLAPRPGEQAIEDHVGADQTPCTVQKDESQVDPITGVLDKEKGKKRKFEAISCTICNLKLTSETNAMEHFIGSKHIKRARLTEIRQIDPASAKRDTILPDHDPYIQNVDSAQFHCKLCGTFSNSYQQVLTHVNGAGHNKKKKKLEEMQGQASSAASHASGAVPHAVVSPRLNESVTKTSIVAKPILVTNPVVRVFKNPAVETKPPGMSSTDQSMPPPATTVVPRVAPPTGARDEAPPVAPPTYAEYEVPGRKNQQGWFYCRPCNISVPGTGCLTKHTQSKAHRDRLNTIMREDREARIKKAAASAKRRIHKGVL